jgi:putative hydrolase of the HAD superfamily
VPRALNTPTGILFDLDGTIIGYGGAEEACLREACAEVTSRAATVAADQFRAAVDRQARRFWSDPEWARSVAQGRSDVRSVSGAIFHAALVEVGVDDPDFARGLAERYRDLREAGMFLFPGALDILAQFRALGIRLALVTNGSAAYQRMKIERFGLARCFDYVLVEGEFGSGKPERCVYEAALQALGCHPANAWMVGDDLHNDVAAPQKLGMSGIWVDARGVGVSSDSPTKPDRIVRSIRELGAELGQPLEVVDYDPRWPELFAIERERLVNALGPSAVKIQHVGSTSVPALAAKPVIDIAIGIKEYPWPSAPIEAIVALGYEHKGEHGIPRRHYFRKGVPRTHHVHVLELNSEQYAGHILLRDYLRSHPGVARQYEALKRGLVRTVRGDHRAYEEGKAEFIRDIISRARHAAMAP